MSIFQNIVNHKINTITTEELLRYARQFQIPLNVKEAQQVAQYLNGKQINVFSDQQRIRLLKDIANITSPQTAQALSQLFNQFKGN